MKNSIIMISLLALLLVSCKNKNNQGDASGTFEAIETIVSAEANGKILELNLEEGQLLKQGQAVGHTIASDPVAADAKPESDPERPAGCDDTD
jgi:HlyD family secretion protein